MTDVIENLGSSVGARIKVNPTASLPSRLAANQTFRAIIRIVNENAEPIVWTDEHRLTLSYRWIDSQGHIVERDGERSILPMPLKPGEPIDVELVGRTPVDAGDYTLLVSLVLEGVHWASDISQGGHATYSVAVTSPPEWPEGLDHSQGGRALRGAFAAEAMARMLDERPMDTAAGDPDPPTYVSQTPAVIERIESPKRASLPKRMRAWLRHLLGIVEMRSAVEELLRRSAEQHQQLLHLVSATAEVDSLRAEVRQLRASFTKFESIPEQMSDQAQAASRQFSSVAAPIAESLERLTNNVHSEIRHRQRQDSRERATAKAIRKDLKSISAAVAGTREQLIREFNEGKLGVALVSSLRRIQDDCSRLVLLDQIQASILAIPDYMIATAERSNQQLYEQIANSLPVATVLASLRKLNEWAEKAGDLGRIGGIERELHELSERIGDEVIVELFSSLRNLAKWTDQAGDLGRIGGIERDVRELSQRISDKVIVELISSLRNLAEWADQAGDLGRIGGIDRAVHELSERIDHKVIVELISSVRNLAEWADQTGDLRRFDSIEQMVRDLAQRLSHVAEQIPEGFDEFGRRLPSLLDRLQFHAAATSSKLDSLLIRETLAVNGARMVLARNAYGFLAIQDDDVAAIAYYSSGALPEAGTVALVERFLRPGQVVLDVGANVGIYTLIGARKVGSRGKVIAVEPVPDTVRMLRATVAINGIGAIVDVHDCALGARSGVATIHAGATSGHSSFLAIHSEHPRSFDIKVMRGNDLLGGKKPALIKIDVEGWEMEVIKGLRSLIKRSKTIALIVEFSPLHITAAGWETSSWIEEIRALDKRIWTIEDDPPALRPLRASVDLGEETVNLFVASTLPDQLRSMEVGA